MGSGTNDVVILTTCIAILAMISVFAPLIAREFRVSENSFYGQQIDEYNLTGVPITPSDSGDSYKTSQDDWYNPPTTNILGIIGGFFVGYAWMPFYINIFMWIIRLVMAVIIYRLIRSGSG